MYSFSKMWASIKKYRFSYQLTLKNSDSREQNVECNDVKSWGHAVLSFSDEGFFNVIIVVSCNLAQAIQAITPAQLQPLQMCVCGEAVSIDIPYNLKYCFFALGWIDSRRYTLEEMFNELDSYFL